MYIFPISECNYYFISSLHHSHAYGYTPESGVHPFDRLEREAVFELAASCKYALFEQLASCECVLFGTLRFR